MKDKTFQTNNSYIRVMMVQIFLVKKIIIFLISIRLTSAKLMKLQIQTNGLVD
jgi:hypothetical protein